MKKSILIIGLIGMFTPVPAQAGWFDTAASWLTSGVEQVKQITPSFVSNGWHSLTQAGSSVKKQVEASPATFVAIAAVAGTAVGSLWAAAKSFMGLQAENERLKAEQGREQEILQGTEELLEVVIEGAREQHQVNQHLSKENGNLRGENRTLTAKANQRDVLERRNGELEIRLGKAREENNDLRRVAEESRNEQLKLQIEIMDLERVSGDQAKAHEAKIKDLGAEAHFFLRKAAEKELEAEQLQKTLAAVKKEVSDTKAEVFETLQLLKQQKQEREQREKELKEEFIERAIQAALSNPLERHDLLFHDRDLKAHPLYRYAFDVDSPQASDARKEARAIVKRCRAMLSSGESSKAEQETFKIEYAPVEPLGSEYAGHGTIILYCIHGTWSNNEEFVGNMQMVNSTNLILAAQQIADAYKKQVIIKTSSWSGELALQDRQKAGIMLFDDIRDNHSSNEIWMIAHSHGCNVASIAANRLAARDICIKKGIFIASPTLDEPPCEGKSHNFEHLIQFYGSGDFTQMAGSIEGKYNFDRKMPMVITNDRKVHNVRVQYFGADANHVNIKWIVSEHLGKLLVMLETIYQDCFDLDVDLTNGKHAKPMMAIRHPEVVKEDSSKLEKAMKWSRCVEDAFPHLLKTEHYKHKYNGKSRASLDIHAQTGHLMYGTKVFFNAWDEVQSAGRDGKTVFEFDALGNLERSSELDDMANSFVDIRAPQDNMVENSRHEKVDLKVIANDYPENSSWWSNVIPSSVRSLLPTWLGGTPPQLSPEDKEPVG